MLKRLGEYALVLLIAYVALRVAWHAFTGDHHAVANVNHVTSIVVTILLSVVGIIVLGGGLWLARRWRDHGTLFHPGGSQPSRASHSRRPAAADYGPAPSYTVRTSRHAKVEVANFIGPIEDEWRHRRNINKAWSHRAAWCSFWFRFWRCTHKWASRPHRWITGWYQASRAARRRRVRRIITWLLFWLDVCLFRFFTNRLHVARDLVANLVKALEGALAPRPNTAPDDGHDAAAAAAPDPVLGALLGELKKLLEEKPASQPAIVSILPPTGA